jgi:hypothetical protein
MKSGLTLLAYFILALNAAAQKSRFTRIFVDVVKEKNKTYAKINADSTIFYGDTSWLARIEMELNKSVVIQKPRKKGIYQAAVSFIIAKDGTIVDVACIKEDKFGICEEMVKLTKKSPRWTVGEVKVVKE